MNKLPPCIFIALGLFAVIAFSTRWDAIVGPWTSERMPKPVSELIDCFHELKLKDFVPRGEMRDEFVAYQRLTVAAWPIEVSDASSNVVFLLSEEARVCPSAQILCRRKEAAVARCAR